MVRAAKFPGLMVACALLAIGCHTAPKPIAPLGRIVVTLDPSAARSSLTTKLQFEVKLELPPPRVPGSTWQIIQRDARFLQQLTAITPVPATGRSTVNFLTLHTGRTLLKFVALPANAGHEARPTDFCDLVLTIQ